jgi:hypothetical protein
VKAFSGFIGIEAARRNPLARFGRRGHLDDLIFGLAISVRMRVLRESRGGHDARNKKPPQGGTLKLPVARMIRLRAKPPSVTRFCRGRRKE